MKKAVVAAFLLSLAGTGLSGCGLIGVKPWQRDLMARQTMQLDADPALNAFEDHIYFSKEASSGGRGFGGGDADATESAEGHPAGVGDSGMYIAGRFRCSSRTGRWLRVQRQW